MFIPITHCRESRWCVLISTPYELLDIEKAILACKTYLLSEKGKMVSADDDIRTPTWKEHSKYKSRKAFVNNNNCGCIYFDENEIKIWSYLKSLEFVGQYGDVYKDIKLPLNSSIKDIAVAVVDVISAIDEFYSSI